MLSQSEAVTPKTNESKNIGGFFEYVITLLDASKKAHLTTANIEVKLMVESYPNV